MTSPTTEQTVPVTERRKRMRMHLTKALAYLVEDWRERENAGKLPVRLTIRDVFDSVYVDGQASTGYHGGLTPNQVANLIEMDLCEVGSLEAAQCNARRFTTRRGLLRTTDLYEFLREL